MDADAVREYQAAVMRALEHGDSPEAVGVVTEAIARYGPHWRLFSDRPTIRDGLGDVEGARDDWTRAIEAGPANDAALAYMHGGRAVARTSLGDDVGAVDDFAQAIRLRWTWARMGFVPHDAAAEPGASPSPAVLGRYARVYANRAAALGRLGRREDAREDFAVAARLFLESGDAAGARRAAEEAARLRQADD